MKSRPVTRILAYTFLHPKFIHILNIYFNNFMKNIAKEWDFNPIRKGVTALGK